MSLLTTAEWPLRLALHLLLKEPHARLSVAVRQQMDVLLPRGLQSREAPVKCSVKMCVQLITCVCPTKGLIQWSTKADDS